MGVLTCQAESAVYSLAAHPLDKPRSKLASRSISNAKRWRLKLVLL